MSIVSKIIGDDGKALQIYGEGYCTVAVHQHPPIKESITALPFRQYFTDNGGLSGSNVMGVDGSVIAQDFFIAANPEYDIYIKYITCEIGDGGSPALNKFGALTALTNGVEFEWQSQEVGSLTIHDGIKDNLEFFRLSDMTPVITDLSGSGADAITVTWDLSKIFGSQWGVKLSQGTTEKLLFRVNDALAGLAEFNIIGHGTKV